MQALGEYGPHKVVNPVIKNLEQQLLSQQLLQKYQGPPPGAPTPLADPVADVPAQLELELMEDDPSPARGIDNDEPIAHHPV